MNNAPLIEVASAKSPEPSPCQTCGACCSFASDWPRFTTEEDSELERIPGLLVAVDLSGMRCAGDRCSALVGEVGVATACTVYDARPHVCRACVPGDEACGIARSRFGLAELTLGGASAEGDQRYTADSSTAEPDCAERQGPTS